MTLVELPYVYLSVLNIEKVNKNGTYECEGNNPSGSDIKAVAVEVLEPERHFYVKDKHTSNKINKFDIYRTNNIINANIVFMYVCLFFIHTKITERIWIKLYTIIACTLE